MAVTGPHPLPGTVSTRVVAFTTPENYAVRLSHLIRLKRWKPLWCPTVVVEATPATKASLKTFLERESYYSLGNFSAIAFTSRTGISAFSQALDSLNRPLLAPSGGIFTISTLGKDSELLEEPFLSRLCDNVGRIRVLVPKVATPMGMVEALGSGGGRRVMCPVPVVEGLAEPPVVPDFLRALGESGWVPERVGAYLTRWAGAQCTEKFAEMVAHRSEIAKGLDAVVFTSTAEVEGMLKSLAAYGVEWEAVRRCFPAMVVAAHGPVTAAGAEKLGVEVDLVSSKFGSFAGVIDALESNWQVK